MKRELLNICIPALCISLLMSCEDAEMGSKDYPYPTMEKVEVMSDGANFRAVVRSPGNQVIQSHGFIWNENNDKNFGTWTKKELTGTITGTSFWARINTDISSNEVYYVRPFIITTEQTVYGPPVQFTGLGSKALVIHDFNPKEGFDGTLVEMTGENFSLKRERISVSIGNVPAQVTSSAETFVAFTIPESGVNGWAQLRIVSGEQEVLIERAFNVLGPQIDEISKTEGFPGDIITIHGRYFTQNGSPEVYFNEFKAEILETGPDMLTVAIPVPGYNFSDITVNISVRSGQKVSLPDIPFTIKKSWDIKTPTPFDWTWIYNAFSHNGKGYILEMNSRILYDYDPASDTWNPGSSYPAADRDENNIFVTAGNKLYKIGGINHLGPVNTFWEYDFNSQVWTRGADIPFAFTSSTHTSLNGEEYIITNTGQVFRYRSMAYSLHIQRITVYTWLLTENIGLTMQALTPGLKYPRTTSTRIII
ncbi:MAG: IPT/TIG domain-containing protein [Bacteroidales bacterium]|nr:IPT/TIG domain-containing protein [Bacteroidales bacterium]